jgi:hypothetical protein
MAVPPPVVDLAPPIVVERATFVTDEFILETSPLLRHRVMEPEQVATIVEPEPVLEAPAPPVYVSRPIVRRSVVDRALTEPEPEPQPRPASPVPQPQPVAQAPQPQQTSNRIQLVVSPIHSFPRLLEIQRRLEAVHSIQELQLRDYRNGIATFGLAVGEAISAHEFGAVVQMLGLGLRLLGATALSAELRLEDESATA